MNQTIQFLLQVKVNIVAKEANLMMPTKQIIIWIMMVVFVNDEQEMIHLSLSRESRAVQKEQWREIENNTFNKTLIYSHEYVLSILI